MSVQDLHLKLGLIFFFFLGGKDFGLIIEVSSICNLYAEMMQLIPSYDLYHP
jgi:hypothetical protein